MFVLLRVAQESYNENEHADLWKSVADKAGVPLAEGAQRKLGELFRRGLKWFGYEVICDDTDKARRHLTPILMHTVPRASLPGLVKAIDKCIDQYGTDPDSETLREVADTCQGLLQRNVRRILKSQWRGAEEVWTRLALVVSAARDGRSVEDALDDLPSAVDREDVWQAIADLNQPTGRQRLTSSQPQLRYDARDGWVQLWIPDGTRDEWQVLPESDVCWDDCERVFDFLSPVPDRLTVTRNAVGGFRQEIATSFTPDNCPRSFWFRATTGKLVSGNRIRSYGLEPGVWYLICDGEPQLPPESRKPLHWPEPWSAWEVEVVAADPPKPYSVPGLMIEVPLARRPIPRMEFVQRGIPHRNLAPVPVNALFGEEGIPVYSEAPWVVSNLKQSFELVIRQWKGGRFIPADRKRLTAGSPAALCDQPGIYELREAGSRRIRLFAVIPELSVDGPTPSPDGETIEVRVHASKDAGEFAKLGEGSKNIELESVSLTEWLLRAPTVEPILQLGWRYPGAEESCPALVLQWFVPGLRWRILLGGEVTPWCRSMQQIDQQRLGTNPQLEIQTPEVGQLKIDDLTVGKMQPCATGYCVRRPLLGYGEVVHLAYEGRRYDAVRIVRRPIIDKLQAEARSDRLAIEWSGSLPEGTELLVWNPLAPQTAWAKYPVPPAPTPIAIPWPSVPAGEFLAVAFAKGSGFGELRYEIGIRSSDKKPWAVLCPRPGTDVNLGLDEVAQAILDCQLDLLSPRDRSAPRSDESSCGPLFASPRHSGGVNDDSAIDRILRQHLSKIEQNPGQVPLEVLERVADELRGSPALFSGVPMSRLDSFCTALRGLVPTIRRAQSPIKILRSLCDYPAASRNELFLECLDDGVDFGRPCDLIALDLALLDKFPCPLAYYRSLWLIRHDYSNASAEFANRISLNQDEYQRMQLEAAHYAWDFHGEWDLPSPDDTSPWKKGSGYLSTTNGGRERIRFTLSPGLSAGTFERFAAELGLDSLRVAAMPSGARGIRYDLTWDGPSLNGWSLKAVHVERPTKAQRQLEFGILSGRTAEHYDKVGSELRSKRDPRSICVEGWRPCDLLEALDIRNRLVRWGEATRSSATIPPLGDLAAVDQELKADVPTRDLHASLFGPAPQVSLKLWDQPVKVRPEYRDVPDTSLLAWRLAWLDRLTVWRGRDYLLKGERDWDSYFGSSSQRGAILPGRRRLRPDAFRTTFVAALRAWPDLMTRCLALVEFLYAVLAQGGLGIAAKFEGRIDD